MISSFGPHPHPHLWLFSQGVGGRTRKHWSNTGSALFYKSRDSACFCFRGSAQWRGGWDAALAPALENNIPRIPLCSCWYSANSWLESRLALVFTSLIQNTHCLHRLHHNTRLTQQADMCVVCTEGWFILFQRETENWKTGSMRDL